MALLCEGGGSVRALDARGSLEERQIDGTRKEWTKRSGRSSG